MLKFRSYISMLLLALLLSPIVEKAIHQFEHSKENHCEITGIHFCAKEHNCSICDYVFSSSNTPSSFRVEVKSILAFPDYSFPLFVNTPKTVAKLSFSLRAPPVC